jgi:CheY-like chemotaxis protein
VSKVEPKVLAAGIERVVFERLAPVLRRDAVEVDWVATPEAGVGLAANEEYDVIILDAEPSDWDLEKVVRNLRIGTSPSRNAAVMVLAEPDQVDAARALKSSGVNRVMLISDPPQMICQQMAGLLDVAPRVSLRCPMNLKTALGNSGREIFCQTVNLSSTGMLVRTQTKPQLGAPVVFRLHLSDPIGEIVGRGEMVRHASRFQGGADGVGVRFLNFTGDGAQRLQEYLEARDESTEPAPRRVPAATFEDEPTDTGILEGIPEFDPLGDPDLRAFIDTEMNGA